MALLPWLLLLYPLACAGALPLVGLALGVQTVCAWIWRAPDG